MCIPTLYAPDLNLYSLWHAGDTCSANKRSINVCFDLYFDMYGAPISRTASPAPSMGYMSPSINDFQIEKVARTPAPKKSFPLPPETVPAPGYGRDEFTVYRDSVNRFLNIKARQFAVSGRVPCDSSQLVLFFRSKVSLSPSTSY